MAYKENIIEEAYILKRLEDNKNINHRKHSNEYTFNYNYQWRNIYNQSQEIAIRSVKLWRAVRDIVIGPIPIYRDATPEELKKNPNVKTISDSITVYGYISHSMFEDIKDFNTNPQIKITYNVNTKVLAFTTNKPWHFDYGKFNETKQDGTPGYKLTETEDFKVITGGLRFADGTPGYENEKCNQIKFYNIWDRENIHVRVSFGDLTNEGFLGVSNEQFIPPKRYPVNNNDQKFKLFLYDCTDKEIELPNDGKDTLIVEAMMISHT